MPAMREISRRRRKSSSSQSSIGLYANTTNAPEIPFSDVVKAERTNYFDVGLVQKITANWSMTIDAYYKDITNLLDEGQFGQALILTPFNYAKGYAEGVEIATTLSQAAVERLSQSRHRRGEGQEHHFRAIAVRRRRACLHCRSLHLPRSRPALFVLRRPAYRFGASRLSADVLAGSGLRNTPDGAPPNSGKLPGYATVGIALIHEWKDFAFGNLEGRVGVTNLFDKSYLLRDGSGVGVGAPQYGGRRTWYAGLAQRFCRQGAHHETTSFVLAVPSRRSALPESRRASPVTTTAQSPALSITRRQTCCACGSACRQTLPGQTTHNGARSRTTRRDRNASPHRTGKSTRSTTKHSRPRYQRGTTRAVMDYYEDWKDVMADHTAPSAADSAAAGPAASRHRAAQCEGGAPPARSLSKTPSVLACH